MPDSILVTGAMGFQGSKIVQFLRSRDYSVIGVDKYLDEAKNHATQFFKLDLKHRDSVRLLTEICKPIVVIYCPDEQHFEDEFVDFSNLTFINLMMNVDKTILKGLGVCLNSLVVNPLEMTTLDSLYTFNTLFITDYFAKKYKLEKMLITKNDNLLKDIKRLVVICMEGGNKDGNTNEPRLA